MANLWFLKSGEPKHGKADVPEKTLEWCIETLGLQQSNWFTDLDASPVIGEKEDPRKAPALGLRHAVVQLFTEDVQDSWKPGFYLLETNATEIRKRLGLY